MSLLLAMVGQSKEQLPELMLKALLEYRGTTNEGALIQAVALPWFDILRILQKDPSAAYQIDPRKWEEIIAGAYNQAGFDEVILTPRSADKGRDIVATKRDQWDQWDQWQGINEGSMGSDSIDPKAAVGIVNRRNTVNR